MERLLFVGASVSQVAAIRFARAAGYWLAAVDGDPDAIAGPLVDAFEVVDFTDVERVIEVARSHMVDGVLAVASDRAVLPAAQVAESLSLPGIGSQVAARMTDKGAMRACLAAAGIRQPQYAVIDAVDDQLKGQVRLPAVVKPVDSGGQRGLFRVNTDAELERCLPQVLAFSASGRAIIETYVEGDELNGMLVVRDGEPTLLTFSDRLRPPGRGFGVGWAHSYPSTLPPHALAEAKKLALEAVRVLGLRNGIAFPQLIVDAAGRAWLVEIAARIAAGQMADLVRYATGINLYQVAIAQALGKPVADSLITASDNRPLAIRFFTADPGVLPVGVVESISGLDAVRSSPGVLAADLYFQAGHQIKPVQVDADRSGYVIATGLTAAEALARADHAATKLNIRVKPVKRNPDGLETAKRAQMLDRPTGTPDVSS